MTKPGRETIHRKSATSNIEIVKEISMFFHEWVDWITSRDYNPIFDTDFASLVRYGRFPSLLYSSGATFLKIGLWYGGAASSFIPILSVYIIFPTSFFIVYVLCYFSILRHYLLVKPRFYRVSRSGLLSIGQFTPFILVNTEDSDRALIKSKGIIDRKSIANQVFK